jgi:hypothetical protein
MSIMVFISAAPLLKSMKRELGEIITLSKLSKEIKDKQEEAEEQEIESHQQLIPKSEIN